MRSLHRFSKGIPRIINNVCDKALLSAFVRDSDEVSYWDVRRAIKEVSTLV
jgi:general secretion pathway protein A